MDYGALPKGRGNEDLDEERRKWDEANDTFMGLSPSSSKVFLASYIVGVGSFLTTLIIFNTILYTHPNVVYFLIVLTAVLSLRGVMAQKGPVTSWKRNEKDGSSLEMTSVWARPLSACCLIAVALGCVFGLFCYDVYGYLSFIYRNSRTYQNVVPSEPAASVADAGRMLFAHEAFVEQTKAVGYGAPDGRRYCVAPLRDMVETTHVEFWAVGYDCCGWSESFECDGAADPDARGGIVVFDNPGIFTTSNRDYYDLARRKAEASYDLISAKTPIYVRWVKDDNLKMLQNFYEWRTAGFIILTTSLYAAVSSAFAYTFATTHYKTYFHLVDAL